MKRLIALACAAAMLAQPAVAAPQRSDRETIKALTARIADLEARLTRQEDIEKVRVLAHTYGYYMDNALYDQVLAMFSPNIVSCEVGGYGVYVGIKGCTRMWKELMGSYYGGASNQMAFGRIAKHELIKDVITIAPDGKSAHGRFDYFSFGATYGRPDGTSQQLGVYNFDFVKEDGVWKIAKFFLSFNTIAYNARTTATEPAIRCPSPTSPPDLPSTWHHPFPESGVIPFFEPNPVTGQPIPDYVNPTRYFQGNWPGEFGGPCGKRPDAPPPAAAAARAPTGR